LESIINEFCLRCESCGKEIVDGPITRRAYNWDFTVCRQTCA